MTNSARSGERQRLPVQRETGLTLVTRIGRGIEPTAAGLSLAEQIDGVLSLKGATSRIEC